MRALAVRFAALAFALTACGETESAVPPPNVPSASTTESAPSPTEPKTPASSAPEAKPSRVKTTKFDLSGGTLKIPAPIAFHSGNEELSDESDEPLLVVLDFLEARSDVTVLRIEGHTDSDLEGARGQALSEKRALSSARWLIAHGVACQRLMPVGFGATKPVAAGSSASAKAENRRVAFIPAALRGRPMGGMPLDGGGRPAGDPCR